MNDKLHLFVNNHKLAYVFFFLVQIHDQLNRFMRILEKNGGKINKKIKFVVDYMVPK